MAYSVERFLRLCQIYPTAVWLPGEISWPMGRRASSAVERADSTRHHAVSAIAINRSNLSRYESSAPELPPR